MRLAAWNCCAGPLERKLAALESLEADIAVVPECPRLPAVPGRRFWLGDNPRKGMAVLTRPPWRIRPSRPRAALPRFFQPFRVTGPVTFRLWAIWPQKNPRHPYVRSIHYAIDHCPRLFSGAPTVVLGDFNSNTIWDDEHPRDRSHTALVGRLQALGIVSAYHHYAGEAHGTERTPTFFEYRHAHRPYHIDYGFIPTAWIAGLQRVTVGEHAEWAALSDHMPVVIEVDPTPRATVRTATPEPRRPPGVENRVARSPVETS